MFHMDSILRLQASQRSMAVLEKIYPGSLNNHRNVAVEIIGPINQEFFFQALDKTINRHQILNSYLDEDEIGCFLTLGAEKNLLSDSFNYIDASHLKISPNILDLYETLRQLNKEFIIELPFDVNKGPFYRVALVKINDDVHQLLMLFNHLVVDESSIGIIFQDLSACYNAISNNTIPNLANLLPLTQYNFSISAESYEARLNYWKNQLKDLNALNLPTDFLPNTPFQFKGKRHRFKLEKSLINKLNNTHGLKDVSLNQKILACVYTLLYRYTNETDICIGITSANRRFDNVSQAEANRLVNCFFNSIPIRTIFSKNSTYVHLALEVKKVLSEGLKNQLSLDTIYQEALNSDTTSKLNFTSPFNILFVLNQKKPTLTLQNTIASNPVELDLGYSKLPYFGINLDEVDDGFDGFFEINTDLFADSTIERMIGHLLIILNYVAEYPECNISEIPILLKNEKDLISDYSMTEKEPSFTGCVHEFFKQQANKNPTDIAVVFHHENGTKETISYRELDTASFLLGAHLLRLGVTPGRPVGICLPRSINYIIAILGVMKAGGVFVPTEPDIQAKEALNYKISTASTIIVIVDNNTASLINNHSLEFFNIDNLYNLPLTIDNSLRFPKISPEDPAYIMFTSGSSGETPKPKGVISLHRGFTNLLNGLISQSLKENLKIISMAPVDFDAILYDFLVAIATGGEMHLYFDKGRCSPQVLNDIITKENIDYGVFLPYFFDFLDPQLPLSTVICMGAMPHEETMILWKNAKVERKVYNAYGATEAGICNSFFLFEPGKDCTIIGNPIPNMQIHILDEYLRPCPIGVPGQMYLSGPGIAAGYLGYPELTKKKFLSLSFDQSTFSFKINDTFKHPNFYATGDRGCYILTKNGLAVKYMGRIERQLKLQGTLLVDLNTIETILRKHSLVQDAIVQANKDETALAAYIIPSTPYIDFTELHKEIYDYLNTTMLPTIAHPQSISILKSWPLMPNGKIDLRNLPVPIELNNTYAFRPVTDVQELLQTIWSQVLSCKKNEVAIHKSFKNQGGNSLSLAKLEFLINVTYKSELNLAENTYIGFETLKKDMTIDSLEKDLKPFMKTAAFMDFLPENAFFNGNSLVFFSIPSINNNNLPVASSIYSTFGMNKD